MGISKNGGNWHLEAFLCYFTCLNLIFVKILGNFQLGHHYYCLIVTGHMLATTSSNEYAKWLTLDFTIHDDIFLFLINRHTSTNLFIFSKIHIAYSLVMSYFLQQKTLQSNIKIIIIWPLFLFIPTGLIRAIYYKQVKKILFQ